jgi:hypothetical protein
MAQQVGKGCHEIQQPGFALVTNFVGIQLHHTREVATNAENVFPDFAAFL